MKTYDLPKRLAQQSMREADAQLRAQHARGEFDIGDPNNPIYNNGHNYARPAIFGYEVSKFMEKQYK